MALTRRKARQTPVHEVSENANPSSQAPIQLLAEAAEAAEARLESLRQTTEDRQRRTDDKEIKLAELELTNARLKQEAFVWEHDSTGALKGHRFGSDLAAMLERLQFEVAEDGAASFAPTRLGSVLYVNLGELDRLNDVSHDLGDQMLAAMHSKLQRVVQAQLGEAYSDETVKLHRVAANDFAVTLEGFSAPQLAEQIAAAFATGVGPNDIARELPEGHHQLPQRSIEPAPVSVSLVSLEQARAIFNRLPRQRFEGHIDEREAWQKRQRTEFISVLRETAQVFSDFEKTRARLKRMIEKIQAEDSRGEQARDRSDVSAEVLYTKYLQKSLSELFHTDHVTASKIQVFKDFKDRLSSLGAFDPKRQTAWDAVAFESSMREALQQSSERLSGREAAVLEIADSVRRSFEQQAPRVGRQMAQEIKSALEKAVESQSTGYQESDAGRARQAQEFDARLNDHVQGFGPTEGETIIRAAQAHEESLESATSSSRGSEGAVTQLKLENAQLELRLLLAQRDAKTGLHGRGMYYQTLEEQLQAHAPTTVIAMDMAFLKYFDRDGGVATGDRAILAAGRVLAASARELVSQHSEVSDLRLEAFRLGGDEFSILLNTADQSIVQELQQIIKRKTLELGPIPAPEDARAARRYVATELQFNFGVKSERQPQANDTNVKVQATKLSHAADEAIIPHKTLNRYVFLILKRLTALQAKAPQEKERLHQYVDALTARSHKALRGDGQLIQRIADDLFKRGQDTLISARVIEQVVDSIIETVQQALAQEHEHLAQQTHEYRVELTHQLEIALLEWHVEDLVRLVEIEHALNFDLQEQVKQLKRMVEAARGEREKIADLRQNIHAVKAALGAAVRRRAA